MPGPLLFGAVFIFVLYLYYRFYARPPFIRCCIYICFISILQVLCQAPFYSVLYLYMFYIYISGSMPGPLLFGAVFIYVLYLYITGSMPGPLLFGAVFDGACLLWEEKCGGGGSCLYSDNH